MDVDLRAWRYHWYDSIVLLLRIQAQSKWR